MAALHYPGTPGTTLYAGMATPAAGTLLTTFSLENWSASTSRTLFRGGMPFKKGDVPAGNVPEIRRQGGDAVAAQFDQRTTWSDGSLKFCVCHLRDDDLSASGSQVYEVYSKPGAFDNTGSVSLSSVAASDALTVEVSSLAQWDGSASATRGSGAALASFAAHAAVSTRVTKVHSGPVCEGWEVWGMFRDGAAGDGAEDAHLKAIWHVDVWKDASGNVIDTEFAAELAQDWWGVAGKYRLDYTATLKRNGTTVQAYTGIQHPYHAHWATVRTQDDDNHARRHWVGSIPTLLYKFSKAYWKASRVLPPYDTTFAPASSTKPAYTTLGNMQHRAAIDATGDYQGRGVLPNMDAKAFMRQTAFDNRVSRTNAFAGLHIPYHYRDERTRTRPTESADVANTLIPLLWLPKASSASTFDGLPEPKHAYRGEVADNISYKGGWVAQTGGTGVWSVSADTSHAVAYCTYAYMLEGERYMLNGMVDLATNAAHALNGNIYGGLPRLHWYENTSARAEMSIPSTQWSGVPDIASGQERSLGWSANLLGHAAALAPDAEPQGQYLKAWNAHCADYLTQCLTYTPPSLKAAGLTYQGMPFRPMRNLWQTAIITQGCHYNAALTEAAGFKAYAEMVSAATLAVRNRALYDLGMYRTVYRPTTGEYTTGNPFLAASDYLHPVTCTISSNVVTLSASLRYAPQAGDAVYFLTTTESGGTGGAIPTGATEGQALYVVSPSGSSFSLATSPGGSPIALSNGTYYLGGRFSGGGAITVAQAPGYVPPADNYWDIHMGAFVFAELADSALVPDGTAAAVAAFMANSDRTTYPAWIMKVEA